jgi:hypothetical protein
MPRSRISHRSAVPKALSLSARMQLSDLSSPRALDRAFVQRESFKSTS